MRVASGTLLDSEVRVLWTVMVAAAAWSAEPKWDDLRGDAGWEEMAVRDSEFGSVRVRHKTIDGAHCLEGMLLTEVKVDKLVEVLLDVPSAKQWSSADIVLSEQIAKEGDEIVLIQHIDIPNWTLVADRYWIVRGGVQVDDKGTHYTWRRVEAAKHPTFVAKALALDANAIEPPVNWGEWAFEPVDGKMKTWYRACSDVGGALPQWLQKAVASRTLPDTVADLVREAKKRGG